MATIKHTRGRAGRAKPEGGFGSHGKPAKGLRYEAGGRPKVPTGNDCYPAGRALGNFAIKVPKSQRKP